MTRDEARDVLRRAFIATGEVPPEMLAMLDLIEVARPAPRKRRRLIP